MYITYHRVPLYNIVGVECWFKISQYYSTSKLCLCCDK